MNQMKALEQKQRGVGLIEVLVAAVIIAIGLLGLAGLQTRSLQMNQSSHYRSQANYYAYEIIDAMRINRDAAEDGDYDFEMGDGKPGDSTVAEASLSRWIEGIQTSLPMTSGDDTGGSVEVTYDSATDTAEVVVTVAWLDERWAEDDDDQVRSVTVRTEL